MYDPPTITAISPLLTSTLKRSFAAERSASGARRRSAFRATRNLIGAAVASGIHPADIAELNGVTAGSVRSRAASPNGIIPPEEFAELAQISERHIRGWERDGLLPSMATDERGTTGYPARSLVRALLADPSVQAASPHRRANDPSVLKSGEPRRTAGPQPVDRPRTHARFWRTASNLDAVTIAHARRAPSTHLTVDSIAREAMINRSTFYTHSTDPTSLLRRALRTALDESAAVLTEATETPTSPRSLDDAICLATDHVNQFLAVYRTALVDGTAAASLFAGLTDFLAQELASDASSSSDGSATALAGAISELIKNTLTNAPGVLNPASIRQALHNAAGMLLRDLRG